MCMTTAHATEKAVKSEQSIICSYTAPSLCVILLGVATWAGIHDPDGHVKDA